MTKARDFVYGVFVGALLSGIVLLLSVLPASGGELQLREVQTAPSNDAHTAGVQDAGPSMVTPMSQFVQYYGVESCGVRMFWLVRADGHIFRLDAQQHPKDYEGFMRSIGGLPHDLVIIPCVETIN